MAKDLTSLCDLTSLNTRKAWLNAVRQGGLALTADMPVWRDFYKMFPESNVVKHDNLSRLEDSGFIRLSKGTKAQDIPPTSEMRYSFWLAFGILPDTQITLEKHFS